MTKLSEKGFDVTADLLEDMARGAAFLGAGGGGDPYLGAMTALHAIQTYGAPHCVPASAIGDDDPVYTAAMMGAPTVMVEKLTGIEEVEAAIAALERVMGKPAKAILPAEIGGLNALVPVAVAAKRGLPLIDADGMGRAFPELQMVTFAVDGVSTSPLAVCNEHGEYHVINARNNKASEDAARRLVIEMGAAVGVSCYPMDGATAKRSAVHGTLSLAYGIGKAISDGRRRGDPFDSLIAYLKSTDYYNKCGIIFSGKVVDLDRRTERGFTLGACKILSNEGDGSELEVIYQNEYLRARVGDRTLAIVPDLTCILDAETAEPITTEGLRYGQRVKVMGVSCAPVMRSKAALDLFGPRAFGLDEPFRPVEDLIVAA